MGPRILNLDPESLRFCEQGVHLVASTVDVFVAHGGSSRHRQGEDEKDCERLGEFCHGGWGGTTTMSAP